MFTRPGRTIVLAFALALVLRLWLALAVGVVLDPGELDYNALVAHGASSAPYPPLYPLFLRLVYLLFGAFNGRAVYVVQAIAGSFIVVPMHAAASRLGGRRAGLIAALLGAIYPGFILYAGAIVSEGWSALLVASMLALAAAPMREGLRAGLDGVLVGAGMLLKPTYAFFVPGFLVTTRRKALLFLAALVVVAAPFAVKVSIVHGRFVPLHEARPYGLVLDLYTYGKWRMVDVVYANAVSLYTWHPGENVEGPPEAKTPLVASYYARKYGYLALLWLGLVGLARRARREHLGVILPVLGAVVLPVLFTRVTEPRFRVFLEPLLVLYVALLFSGGASGAVEGPRAAEKPGSAERGER